MYSSAVDGIYYSGAIDGLSSSIDDDELFEPIEGLDTQWARFVLGEPGDTSAPQAWLIQVPAGFTVPRHYHNVHRLEVQLSGGYTENGRERGPGSVTLFSAGVMYGPLHYPEGGTSIEFFSTSEGIEPYFESMPDGAIAEQLNSIGMSPRLAP